MRRRVSGGQPLRDNYLLHDYTHSMMNRRQSLQGVADGATTPLAARRSNRLDMMLDLDMNPYWPGRSGGILCANYEGGSLQWRDSVGEPPNRYGAHLARGKRD